MVEKTLSLPEDALVSMLKSLPEDVLVDVFWKTLVESDVSPLTVEEKNDLLKGVKEFEDGKTIKWENMR